MSVYRIEVRGTDKQPDGKWHFLDETSDGVVAVKLWSKFFHAYGRGNGPIQRAVRIRLV